MKVPDSVWWRIMKCETTLTPPRSGLSGAQFTTLKCVGKMIPKDQYLRWVKLVYILQRKDGHETFKF
jgi:hypothetical protein